MPSPNMRPYNGVSPHVAPLRVEGGRIVSDGPRRKKVAICGSAGVFRMPWEDETFETWSLNNFYNHSRDSQNRIAASIWFELHQIAPDFDGPDVGLPIQDVNDMAWLDTCPVPIYTTESHRHRNENAVVWPVRERIASGFRPYFACTFAMQVCEALHVGFEEIHIFGLDLLLGTKREATVEAACLHYWLGLAEGRGVRVVTEPDELLLLRHPFIYGHDYWRERRFVESYVRRWNDLPEAI